MKRKNNATKLAQLTINDFKESSFSTIDQLFDKFLKNSPYEIYIISVRLIISAFPFGFSTEILQNLLAQFTSFD